MKMYKTLTIHMDPTDEVDIHREDDKVEMIVVGEDESVDIFIDPVHFPALREAMDMAEARNAKTP